MNHKMGVVLNLNGINHGYQMAYLGRLLLALQGELYILRCQRGTVVELYALLQGKLHGHIIYVLPAVRQVAYELIVLRQAD